MGVSKVMGVPAIAGLFHGKSTPKMDDFGGSTRPEKSAGCAKKGEATGSVCNWKSPAIG